MKETELIRQMFEETYDGENWVDVNLTATLGNIGAAEAAKKIDPNLNTIWEIVNHLIAWRKNVLERVKGHRMQSPADNYFKPVEDQSDVAWHDTLQALKQSQQEWVQFLDTMPAENLQNIYSGNNASYYKNIHGIIQHDHYHLGQIVLLAKLV